MKKDDYLVKPVKYIDPSSNTFSGTDWRMLGELELPVGSETNGMVSTWLTEILSPLDMHLDFLNRILKSAEDAAVRTFQAEVITKIEHIHLLIFVPAEYSSKNKTWGFFRIEKVENTHADIPIASHAIEFYLYVEGLTE